MNVKITKPDTETHQTKDTAKSGELLKATNVIFRATPAQLKLATLAQKYVLRNKYECYDGPNV